jgi:hypothetical protein
VTIHDARRRGDGIPPEIAARIPELARIAHEASWEAEGEVAEDWGRFVDDETKREWREVVTVVLSAAFERQPEGAP